MLVRRRRLQAEHQLKKVLEQVVIWPVRLAPAAPGRGLYKDSALRDSLISGTKGLVAKDPFAQMRLAQLLGSGAPVHEYSIF